MYQLILERRINNYKLPDNVYVIAAGNRITDKAISYDLTAALADRFIHFVAMPSLESWMKWVNWKEENGEPIHTAVKVFLQTRPDFLDSGFNNNVANTDDKINCSPRSWERVSNIMHEIQDEKLLKVIVPGVIGLANANEYFFTTEELSSLAPMSEYIKLGLEENDEKLIKILPQTTAALFGLSYALPGKCVKEKDFLGACYVLKVMSDIEDDKPRKEILASSIINLLNKANKVAKGDLPRKITRSKAYQIMREEHMKAFDEMID